MFGNNPFNEQRAAQKVQEKKAIDEISKDKVGRYLKKVPASAAQGADMMARGDKSGKGVNKLVKRHKGTSMGADKLTGKAKVPATEGTQYVIPEEIPANERTAFHGAAAAAAKAGKKSFNFGGKTHPVTMKKDTAKAIADDKNTALKVKGTPRAGNNPFRGGRPTVKTEGIYKDMDTEKGEPSPRSDAKVKSDFKKRRKTEKSDVDMNPKLDKGTKDNSMEQKESTGIRAKLMSVLSEKNDRAKHYKGATKPETMDDKLKGKGAKDMMEPAKNPKVDDTEEKGHIDAVKAGKTGPQAKARGGGDNTRTGDQKIIPSATPVKNMKSTMEAYASMYEETHMTIRNGADGLDAAKKAAHKKEYESKHGAKVTFSGNSVTYSGKKANVTKAARAHFPDHKEDGMPSDIHKWHDGKDIHVKHSGNK